MLFFIIISFVYNKYYYYYPGCEQRELVQLVPWDGQEATVLWACGHDATLLAAVSNRKRRRRRGRTVRFSRHTNGAGGGGILVWWPLASRRAGAGSSPQDQRRRQWIGRPLLLLEMESTQVRGAPSLSRASAVPVRQCVCHYSVRTGR
jgi:hypothetical protein